LSKPLVLCVRKNVSSTNLRHSTLRFSKSYFYLYDRTSVSVALNYVNYLASSKIAE
jgi:hypothetical protein